jgi:hypothetical protein
MEADYANYEIAHVIRGFRLFDSESYERHYHRPDGQSLSPGYYVVNWPKSARIKRFDEQAIFRGPFGDRHEAEAAIGRLQRDRAIPEWRKMAVPSSRFSPELV